MTAVRIGHDAWHCVLKAQSGNVLAEYGLIIGLVTLASATSLMMLGQSLQKNWVGIGDTFQSTGTQRASQSVAPTRPTISTFMITLSNGKPIVLDEYPLDTPTEDGSAIPSYRQSQTAAKQLAILANTLGTENLLTQAQADTLMDVSRQMARISAIEKPVEEAYNSNTQGAKSVLKSTFKVQKKRYTLEELLELIRTDASLRGQAPEIEELLERVREAEEAGALTDPVIQHMVNRMVDRVQSAASQLSERADQQSTSSFEVDQSTNGEDDHVLGQNG